MLRREAWGHGWRNEACGSRLRSATSQKPRTGKGLSYLTEGISRISMKETEGFWECYTRWTERDRDKMKWKKGCCTPQILQATNKATQLQTPANLQEKRRMTPRMDSLPRRQSTRPQSIIPRSWNLMDLPSRILNLLWKTDSFLPFLLFGTGMSIITILCLSHHCVLEANNLFSSFTGPKMERGWPQDGSHPKPTHIWFIRFRWWDLGLCANNI